MAIVGTDSFNNAAVAVVHFSTRDAATSLLKTFDIVVRVEAPVTFPIIDRAPAAAVADTFLFLDSVVSAVMALIDRHRTERHFRGLLANVRLPIAASNVVPESVAVHESAWLGNATCTAVVRLSLHPSSICQARSVRPLRERISLVSS